MPAKRYLVADGTRVPSVTSILGHVDADPGGLLYWANQAGLDGLTLEEARSQPLGVGSIVHAAIEAELKGEKLSLEDVDPEMRKQIDLSISAWELWRQMTVSSNDELAKQVLASEVPYVSERYRFGGTLDAVLMVSGRRCLLDFKTANRFYPKDLAQVAAYGILWNEIHPQDPIEQYSLLRISKEDGSFSWHHREAAMSMDAPRSAFLIARELYELAKTLKRMVG